MSADVAEYDEKMRKKKEEEQAMWEEYMEQRKQARIKEEEDLKKLKERQARRKMQRQEHEKIMQEMRRKQEEQRQREFEEKRIKEEEAKRKRLEEAERKRQQMQEALKKQREAAKRSFALNKKSDGSIGPDIASVASLGRADVIKTKEQLAEEKKIAMQFRVKPLNIEGLGLEELKKKANELWDQIVQAESDRYDLEERQKRQEYDLKELSERQRQINRNKALKKGLDPEALSGKYPPKLQVASKYERRLDRRDFGDKKGLFEGGWDKLTKEEQDKWWEDRMNSFKENHGDKKVTKWDPSTLRQQRETDEHDTAIYDDDGEDLDMMDAYKPFISKENDSSSQQQSERRRSSATQQQQQQQTQQRKPSRQEEPEEESEEEEEEEEEEEVEEETEEEETDEE
ncbi:Troponin T, partial [Fragariocoptes setiger]